MLQGIGSFRRKSAAGQGNPTKGLVIDFFEIGLIVFLAAVAARGTGRKSVIENE